MVGWQRWANVGIQEQLCEQMEALRKDILEAISRHISIDVDRVKVDFQHQQNPAEVVINAPVRRTRRPAEEPKPSVAKQSVG